MKARIGTQPRPAPSVDSGRVAEARFFALDGVLFVQFGDGLERAVRWTDLPFAGRLGLEPVAASTDHRGDSVVLRDAAGREVDLGAESLRAALDDQYREALHCADDQERRLVGARLRAVREGANLSQLELARRSGLAQESLSRIETGRCDPRVGTLRRLARGMDLSLEQLLEQLSTST